MSAQGRSATDASAFVLDGAAIAEGVLAKIAEEARALSAHGVTPGLAVVLVGDNPASQTYIAGKGRAAKACGFHSIQHTLPAETSEAELLALVEALNADPAVHGVLVQLPLPSHIDSSRVLEAIAPAKDVDGFHPINVGLLSIGDTSRALIPCTPAGAMILIDKACERLGWSLEGMEAVIIGRSNIVGKPMAQLLLARHCTVTVAHSRTLDLPSVARRADILVAAVGRPEMVRENWIKPGAIVIDVGINRVAAHGHDASGKPRTRLVGDVAYAEAAQVAGAITPVPGGVGRMTIAMLMSNTLEAAKRAGRMPREAGAGGERGTALSPARAPSLK
jgi:methylenetetrahydrofolate dehydrogenase (NADP+) / methenyltetrahydrofolate cyclohydrolase